MRAAISLRLLFALTLMGWGQLAFASTVTYWMLSQYPEKGRFASALAACKSVAFPDDINPNPHLTQSTSNSAWCNYNSFTRPTTQSFGPIYLHTENCAFGHTGYQCNANCDAPKEMVGGQCVTPEPPKDCSAHKGKFITAAVPGTQAGNSYSTPGVVSVDGARYVSSPDGKSRCKPNFDGSGTALCAARFAGDGTCMPAGHPSSADLSDGTFVDVTDSASTDQKCLNFGGSQLCLSPDNAGCDIYKGSPWCYQTGDNCGEVNGTFVCFPKTARQCTYANGKMECIDTGNPQGSKPPSSIPYTSSDHPYNGGNADGNDKNDPKASGSADGSAASGGGAPAADLGETNESIKGLGDKLDESNGLLEDIRDLLTGEGDDSGNSDGSKADAEAEGAAVGNAVGDAITTHMEAADEARNEEVEDVLDQLPNKVGQWFGTDGAAVGLDFIDSIIPQPVACADYVVPFSIKGYTANLRLPVCALMPYKPILEWVIWCATAIGAWRIGYSALRQEDAKAAKGGF